MPLSSIFITFEVQNRAKQRVFGQHHHLIYNLLKTLFWVENTNDSPWHFLKIFFTSLIRNFSQDPLLEPLVFSDTSASLLDWFFLCLCWIHSCFARKLLSGPFIFCYNPLVITKSLSATMGKSWRNSEARARVQNCPWTSRLNLLPRGPRLRKQPCQKCKKSEEHKGDDENNFVSVKNTG